MRLPPKIVTVLSLVQMLFITMGFFVTGAFMNLHRKAWIAAMGPNRLFPASLFPSFIESYGLWLFLIPICWCTVSVFRGRYDSEIVSVSGLTVVIGIALTVLLALMFFVSGLTAITGFFG
jgi:hypothetical protein